MQRRFQSKKKFIIGVSGGFGTGKSTVAGIFKNLGAAVIDADKIAHDLMGSARPGKEWVKKITFVFGKKILKSGCLDRPKLGKIVFSNSRLLKKLNHIIHPQVIRIIQKEIKYTPSRLIVIDAPLLIESGLDRTVDMLIVVRASQDKQIKRIQKRSFLSQADILRRIRCQIPLRDKLRLADFIIDNNGSLKKTKKKVREIWRRLWKS